MLGNCYIRSPQIKGVELDKGKICESLLFFDSVHIDLDSSSLRMIINNGFYSDFLELLECGYITANYSPSIPGLMTNNYGGLLVNSFVVFKLAGDANGKKFKNNRELFEKDVFDAFNDAKSSKRAVKNLSKFLTFKDSINNNVCSISFGDLKDSNYCADVAISSLLERGLPPGLVQGIKISIVELENGRFVIDSNINFNEINKYLGLSGDQIIGSKDLLTASVTGRANLISAAQHNAAFVGPEDQVRVVENLLSKSVGGNVKYQEKIDSIYDFVDCNIPSVREAINSGEKTTKEFISLYKDSFRFKEWLKGRSVDSDIIK